MMKDGAPLLVMLSGGGDSVALLDLIAREELGSHPVRVLHVNHCLRGESSEGDEQFVSELCDSLGVDLVVRRIDVGAIAAEYGLNLEDAGRRVRYEAAEGELDALCERVGANASDGRIVVAHTRDDRVETFFMRAASGAGTGGLGSIAAVRGRIVRPLISVDRAQVRAYLLDRGLSWREDESNDDISRARAYVRAHVIPVMEGLNGGFRDALERTMDLVADDDALLGSMADMFVRDFASVKPGLSVKFDRMLMSTLDHTMARRTVRAALQQGFPQTSRIEADHIEALVGGLTSDTFARDLPGGLSARCECDTLIIRRGDSECPLLTPAILTIPGSAHLGLGGVVTAVEGDPGDCSGDPYSVCVSLPRGTDALAVGSAREGERIRPLGMKGTRKLSDLFIDEKVPRRMRGTVPVLRDGDCVVWVAGSRMSEDYRVTSGSERVVRLEWTEAPGTDTGQE